jgi:hypothetical protein
MATSMSGPSCAASTIPPRPDAGRPSRCEPAQALDARHPPRVPQADRQPAPREATANAPDPIPAATRHRSTLADSNLTQIDTPSRDRRGGIVIALWLSEDADMPEPAGSPAVNSTVRRARATLHRRVDEGTDMAFSPGDHVLAETESTERAARRGVVEEVLRDDPRPRYRIRWDNGHESVYTPADGALRPDASAVHPT